MLILVLFFLSLEASSTYLDILHNKYLVERLSPRTTKELYTVCKIMVSQKSRSSKSCIKRLEQAKISKSLRNKLTILKALDLINSDKFYKATNILENLRNKIRDKELKNFVLLQLGRIYTVQGKLAKAIKAYQSVGKTSKYYRTSLIETSFMLSRLSGDYNSIIEHLDSLIIWYNSPSSLYPPPNDKLVLDIILEKAKTYLKAMDIEKATSTYKDFIEFYNKIAPKYHKLAPAKLVNSQIMLGNCKEPINNIAVLIFSKECISDNLLNVWLTNYEKNRIIKEFKVYNLLDTHKLLSPYEKIKYQKALVKMLNAYVKSAYARIESKKLEAKTGLLQIKLSIKEIRNTKYKKNLEKNIRKLNRLDNLYEALMNGI